jgi:hypothetical protein
MHRLLILIAATAIALTAPAGAGAASTAFSGTTDQGLGVSFTLSGKKVKHFKARVRCTSRRATTFTYPTVPVDRKGRFEVHQAGPSLDGRIKGSKASGELTLPGCNASANEVKFTARA